MEVMNGDAAAPRPSKPIRRNTSSEEHAWTCAPGQGREPSVGLLTPVPLPAPEPAMGT